MYKKSNQIFRLSLLAAGVAGSLAVSPVQGADVEPVVVTATRFEQSLEKVLSDVTVITREEIESKGFSQISDVLFSEAGVQFSSNGGAQQTTSVYIRGQEPDATVVLIDGIRIGQLSGAGGASIQALALEAVERIEILKGNGSALYGADAIGGVIQIITRKAKRTGFGYAVNAGSNGTYGVNLHGQFAGDATRLSLSGGYEDSKGFPAQSTASGGNNISDGYHRYNGLVTVSHALTESIELAGSLLTSETQSTYDSFGQQADAGVKQEVVQTNLIKRWAYGATSQVKLGKTREELDFPGAFAFKSRSDQTQLNLEHVMNTRMGQALFGLESLRQEFDSTFPPTIDQIDTVSALLGLTGNQGAWNYQANLRHDNNDINDSATTGSLASSFLIGPNSTIGGSLGTGFKRPTFTDFSGFSFNPAVAPSAVVNTSLDPEKSRSAELYYRWASGAHKFKLTTHYTEVDDLIIAQSIAQSATRYINSNGTSTSSGASLDWQSRWLGASYGLYYEYLKAELADGQRRPRVAEHSGKIFIASQLGRWTWQGDWILAGSRREVVFGGPDIELAGYGVVNVSASFLINPQASLTMRVENLLGRQYELANGYNTPSQDVMFTFRQSF